MRKKILGIILVWLLAMSMSMTAFAYTPTWKNPIPKSYYASINKAKEACYTAGYNVVKNIKITFN